MDQVVGLVLVAAGIFLCVYGSRLFTYGLAAMGFALGFLVAFNLLAGQEALLRVLLAMVAGAIVGGVVVALARFGLYIAGGILGLVLAVVGLGLLGIGGGGFSGVVATVAVVSATGAGGVFGPLLGQSIVIFASSAAGALLVVNGLQTWFDEQLPGAAGDAVNSLGAGFSLTLFVVVLLIAALGQLNLQDLRNRLFRR
jgi:hypothetical protein